MCITPFVLFILFCHIRGITGIRNVVVVMPPVVRAGSSATLLCLYDLQNSRLYSVKWYRGQYEFYRFIPNEKPPIKIFNVAGIQVDVYSSNQHQVTLQNVPVSISGEVSCEVTTDAPTISTACVSDKLNVQRMDIEMQIDQQAYTPGQHLVAECAATSPALIDFYVNSMRVSPKFVSHSAANKATLNMTVLEKHFQPKGELRLQCSGAVSDSFYISTRVVSIKRLHETNFTSQSLKIVAFEEVVLMCIVFNVQCIFQRISY